MNFVIPEGVRILKSKLRVNSNKIIPTFNSHFCDDKGTLSNSDSYASSTTQGDFLLFLGAVNKSDGSSVASASFCVLGIFLDYFYIPLLIKNIDSQTNRPLVGFAVFNEYYIKYDSGSFTSQVATFVHEVLHALFFHPKLFALFPKNSKNESFLFKDSKGVSKMRGDSILSQIKEHFNCSSIDGGYIFGKFVILINF